MTMLIDGIDFHDLAAMKYWAFPNSWDLEKKKRTVNERIFSDEWLGAQKRDGAFYKFIKSDDGEMELLGRSKSVSGDYLNKIDWVPQLHPFFEKLPNGTCLLGEIYLPSNERAKSTTSIMNCLVDKAVKRQEKEALRYYVFDVLAYDGHSLLTSTAADRFETILPTLERKYWSAAGYVDFVRYFRGKQLWDNLQSLLADGYEGIVITRESALYQPGKRPSKDTLKVKKELQETIDCFVIGVLSPTKQYTGKEIEEWPYWFNEVTNEKINKNMYNDYVDGATIIPVTKNWFNGWAGSLRLGVMKDGKEVEIGSISGITDEIKANWKDYVGHVCTITAMEVMDNAQGGRGLRHPKFVGWRDDKPKEECSYEQIL